MIKTFSVSVQLLCPMGKWGALTCCLLLLSLSPCPLSQSKTTASQTVLPLHDKALLEPNPSGGAECWVTVNKSLPPQGFSTPTFCQQQASILQNRGAFLSLQACICCVAPGSGRPLFNLFWAASQTPSSKSRGIEATWGLGRQKPDQQTS